MGRSCVPVPGEVVEGCLAGGTGVGRSGNIPGNETVRLATVLVSPIDLEGRSPGHVVIDHGKSMLIQQINCARDQRDHGEQVG